MRDPNASGARKVNFDYSRVTFDPSRSVSRSESAQYSVSGSVAGDPPERRHLSTGEQRDLMSLLQRMNIASGPDDEPSKPPAVNVRKTKSLDEHRDLKRLLPANNARTGPGNGGVQPQSTGWDQGFISRKQGILARWQRRLYVLDDAHLRRRTKRSMREVFSVRDVLEIRPQAGGSRPHVCVVILSSPRGGSGRSLKLAFDTGHDLERFAESVLARRKLAASLAAPQARPYTAR